MFKERSWYREQVWEKLGQVFCPSGERDWAKSHAAVPCPLKIDENRFRIYFGSRNAHNEASIGYVDIDPRHPDTLLDQAKEPVLAKGPLRRVRRQWRPTVLCPAAKRPRVPVLHRMELGRHGPFP